jgi:hypothetical protein
MPLLRTQSPKPVQTRIPRNTEPLRARVPSDATVSPGKQNTSILWYKEAALVLNSPSLPYAHPDRLASSFAFSNYLNPSNSHLRHRHTILLLFFLQYSVARLHRSLSYSFTQDRRRPRSDALVILRLFLHFLTLISVSQTALLTFISLEPFTPTNLAPYPSILSALLLGMLQAS